VTDEKFKAFVEPIKTASAKMSRYDLLEEEKRLRQENELLKRILAAHRPTLHALPNPEAKQ
jgi:hypothetical protein